MDDYLVSDGPRSRLFSDPKPAQRVGLAATLLAAVVCFGLTAAGLSWPGLWLVPLLVGLAGAAAAVAIAPWSPGNLAWGGVAAGLAFLTATRSGWDTSVPFLFGALAVLAFAAAGLMLLPQLVRRVAVSFLIVYHFAGILCAVASAPPQSWLTGQLYETLFRPYLQAVYLTNAYHFYSPEPGPATMLWFRLEYEPDADGKQYIRWVKLPNMDTDGNPIEEDAEGNVHRIPRIEYTRRLSLVENATAPSPSPPGIETYKVNRLTAGDIRRIPVMPNMPMELQYREPAAVGKVWLSMYVKHVAETFKHKDRPEKAVRAVKVYRVIHQIMFPHEVGGGRPFDDPSTFHPYYYGEYEPDGQMKKSCRDVSFDANGNIQETQRDPFLYFLIPIVPELTPEQQSRNSPNYNYKVKNYFRIHAGDAEGDKLP